MGWWEARNKTDLLGDGPADTFTEALLEIARAHGHKPTLQVFLDSLKAALLLNPEAHLLDGPLSVTSLTAHFKDGTAIATSDSTRPDDISVRILSQALEDIVTEYEDMEDHRKPRLSEILSTAAFILRPSDQDFVETPTGSSVDNISADTTATPQSERQ